MDVDVRDAIVSKLTEAGGRLRVRSALNPALWLCAIVSMPSLVFACFAANPPGWLGWLISTPVAVTCIGYLVLLVFDRDKLQSEEYQIRKRTLELIEQKGMSGPMTVAAIEAVVVTPEAYLENRPGDRK